MRTLFAFCTAYLLILSNLTADKPAVALVVEEDAPPSYFDFVGTYLVSSIVRVHQGTTSASPITDTRYRIYSNGKEIRVYQADVSDSFHTYEIYRSDGVSEEDEYKNITIKPGLQARQIQPRMTKQLTVTHNNLTMTQFPPISDTIVVTYAKRLEVTKPKE